MKVLQITDRHTSGFAPATAARLEADCHIGIDTVEPSALSSFTAMRIATALKGGAHSVVIVRRRKDLMAAVSARKLARTPFAIVYAPDNAGHLSERLVPELTDAIDAVVVPADSFAAPFAGLRTVVIPPALDDEDETQAVTTDTTDNMLHISWIGPIDKAERLDRAVRAAAAQPRGRVRLHVYGTGAPRLVMPIVKGARHIDGLDIVWHGDQYDDAGALATSTAVLSTDNVPTRPVLMAMRSGIPVLATDDTDTLTADIAALLAKNGGIDRERLNQLSGQAKDTYQSQHSLCFHVEQWRQLLHSLNS